MLDCRKASVRSSAAQWGMDALIAGKGGDLVPCFFSLLPDGCTFQTTSGEAGESLLGEVIDALGPPSSAPQVVKGGSCGGEEEEGEFAFTGAMVSVTWEFPRESRPRVLESIRRLVGPCGETE